MYTEEDSEVYAAKNPDIVHYLAGQQISLMGDSVTKYMMWDNIRALDYLCSRQEVDTQRLAVTGNSGGGQMSAFMGAFDDRLSVIAPSCYITELKELAYKIGIQDPEQSPPNFMKTGLDQADLITAAAPKPYMIGSALFDFFPIDGTRDAFGEARRMYRILEAEDNIDMYVASKPHGFWYDTRNKILRFMCKHFNVEFIENKNIDYEAQPKEEELLCTEGGDINAYNSTTLQQIIKNKSEKLYPIRDSINSIEDFERFKSTIRNSVIDVLGIDLSLTGNHIEKVKRQYEKNKDIHKTDISFYSEEYMKIHSSLYRKDNHAQNSVLVHIGAIESEESIEKTLEQYDSIYCIETRGTGRAKMEPGSWFYNPGKIQNEEASYNCNANMLGRSVMGMKVLDVLSGIKLLRGMNQFENSRFTIYGKEEEAVTALFSAIVSGIKDIKLENLLYSYKSIINSRVHYWSASVFVDNLLKYFDIDDLIVATLPCNLQIKGLLDNVRRSVENNSVENLLKLTKKVNELFKNENSICMGNIDEYKP